MHAIHHNSVVIYGTILEWVNSWILNILDSSYMAKLLSGKPLLHSYYWVNQKCFLHTFCIQYVYGFVHHRFPNVFVNMMDSYYSHKTDCYSIQCKVQVLITQKGKRFTRRVSPYMIRPHLETTVCRKMILPTMVSLTQELNDNTASSYTTSCLNGQFSTGLITTGTTASHTYIL